MSRSSAVQQGDAFAPAFSDEAKRRGKEDVDRAPPPEDVKVVKGGKVIPPPSPKPQLPAAVPMALGGLVVVALGVGITALVVGGDKDDVPPEVVTGSVRVMSEPMGAAILVDGRPTNEKTPTILKDLPVDADLRIEVRLKDHKAVPSHVMVRIPPTTRETTTRFTLKEGRRLRLESNPEGAVVEIEGSSQREVTPVLLPPVPFGESATLTLKLPDFMPARVIIPSRRDVDDVTKVDLVPAKEIDIASSPPGATVVLDGMELGKTPVYDVKIPERKRFRLALAKPGYRSYKKRLRAKDVEERTLEIELEQLPLLAMPMSNADRKEARALDRKAAKVRRAVKGKKRALEQAERARAAIENSGTVFIGEIAEAQKKVDDLRNELGELEGLQAEVEQEVFEFRARILQELD